ncbi:unnamed protein product [Rotaria sp. Silwood2]|nr:unnamed protein product [Rotaria sp. Silwood2]
MANQLNEIFTNRNVSAADVKSKIGNLITEYRRRKKEQGTTGASPCSWRYFDLLDKLLGERAYNDNSLLSDSMIIEQEKLLEDINNVEIPDMALTQVAEQADDSFSSQGNVEEINSPVPSNSNYLSSPSNNIINIIKAVTILHNLCIMSDDGLEIEWNLPLPTHKKPGCNMQTTSGVDVRAALTEYFLQNPL